MQPAGLAAGEGVERPAQVAGVADKLAVGGGHQLVDAQVNADRPLRAPIRAINSFADPNRDPTPPVLTPRGGLADRFDRRRLLILLQLSSIVPPLVLGVLTFVERVNLRAIVVVGLILGVQQALSSPAAQALVPSLVGRDHLGEAVMLNSVSFNLSRALGPLLSTVLIAWIGFGFAFLANAISFIAFAGALAAIPVRKAQAVASTGSVRAALWYAWRSRELRLLYASITAISIASDPVFTVAPTFSAEVLGRATREAGLGTVRISV